MRKYFRRLQFCVPAVLLFVFLAVATVPSSAQTLCPTGTVCVTTWQNDTYRTGDNLSENTITPSSITTDNFGQLCSAQLDGQVYAQPLVVTGVTIQGTPYDRVAYVVTENDSVYAINGTPPAQGSLCQILIGPVSLLQSNLMSPVPCGNIGGPNCRAIKPIVGILGTPVINIDTTSNTGTLYVVAEMQSGSSQSGFTFYHFLHALDITTLSVGNEKFGAPIQICGTGCGSYSSSLFSGKHIQRPGLLLANCGNIQCGNANYVYVAFSMMDGNPTPYPNGFVFGYNATNLNHGTVFTFQTSNGREDASNGGGIWMGGAAPAFGTDVNGNNWIYLTTANGTFDLSTPGGTNAGDSFLKLNPYGLTIDTSVPGYFTPVDQYYRSTKQDNQHMACDGDVDVGSGGVMLIPDDELLNWRRLAVSGDKEGGLWFMDRTQPNGHDTSCDNNCSCMQQFQDKNIQVYWTNGGNRGPAIHTSPAYWEYDGVTPFLNYLFVTQQQNNLLVPGPLIRYPLCGNASAKGPIDFAACVGGPVKAVDHAGGDIINFGWGATPAVSANGIGATDAIVWAISKPDDDASEGTMPGILNAIDAVSMTQLYSSGSSSNNGLCVSDGINPATKFSVPTVANGYVFLGTQSANTIQQNTGYGTFYIFGPNRPFKC